MSTITECRQNKPFPTNGGEKRSRIWNQIDDVTCDTNIYGWFRYSAEEGGEMAGECLENQNATQLASRSQPCGANFRGWMVDRHPTIGDGRVQRRICFSYNQKCTCEFYTSIAVRNCGDYYVYRLNSAPACYARYCGAPAGKKSKGKVPVILLCLQSVVSSSKTSILCNKHQK